MDREKSKYQSTCRQRKHASNKKKPMNWKKRLIFQFWEKEIGMELKRLKMEKLLSFGNELTETLIKNSHINEKFNLIFDFNQ